MAVVEVRTDYGGRLLILETGKLAKQTDAAVLCRYGDTVVLVTLVSNKDLVEGQGFFPLTVDYQEKYYSAGRVPGGFFKRESKPSEMATLNARLIDRPCRPLFPEDYMYETHIVATVLSSDGVNDPGGLACIGASTALHVSDVPWNGPISFCRVGLVGGDFILNGTPTERISSRMDLLVSGGREGVVMVEGSAKEVTEKEMLDAIFFAHQKMQPILDLQDELRSKVGRQKRAYKTDSANPELKNKLEKFLSPGFKSAFAIKEKLSRYEALAKLKDEAAEKYGVLDQKTKEDELLNKRVEYYVEELKASYARQTTLDTKRRIDGREFDSIRDISCEVGLLPRVHGTGLFTRGETQVLAAVTLGTSEDEQKVDSISGVFQKTFMLHYNFPPFSVGEAKPLRAPGRREIGHGNLAERALSHVIPSKEEFPYTIRLVSEVLESNGSSSMATVCSGSLALMDAGVPIKKAVAGVAMGLIKEADRVAILSDILGDEDHLGDMDFKVCGTSDGITAFQMDLKIGSIDRNIMEAALEQAKAGRLHILEKMNATLANPRRELSAYSPRIISIKIKPEKVREVIGSGGKVIRGIIEQTGVKIDIEDDGTICIASVDEQAAQKAVEIISKIIEEAEIGKIYEGKVVRIADFGAFVEIIPGTDGLVHISELDHRRVRRVEDVLREGDTVRVKCLDIDFQGKIRLSRKALLPKEEQSGSDNASDDYGNRREQRLGGTRENSNRERRDSRPPDNRERRPYRENGRFRPNREPRRDDRRDFRDDRPPKFGEGKSFPRFHRHDEDDDAS